MKKNFTFLFLLFLTTVFGQKIVNDSLISEFEKEYINQNQQILKLKNLKKTNEDFYFRLNNNEITIELFYNNGILNLETHQYYFQRKNSKNTDTIINHIKHNNENAIWLYDKIEKAKIEKITPTKVKVTGKSGVFMTDDYYLEFSNKDNYSIKSFPYSDLDTISENYTLKNLVNDLYKKIEVENLKKDFVDRLPSGYHYKNLFSYSFYKMLNSNFYLYYNGNYRLPLGAYFGYYVNKIKKKKFNMGVRFQIQNNLNNNLNIENVIWKGKIFGNQKTYSDYFRLIYEYNKLDYIKTFTKFENKKIIYSGKYNKYISFAIGYDQLKTDKIYSNGFIFGISKDFESIHLEPYYDISVFENRITNYKLGINKSFQIKAGNKNLRIYTSLFYEKTFDFKSLNFSLYVPIKDWIIN